MSVSRSTQKMYRERVMRYAKMCPLEKQIDFWNSLIFPKKKKTLIFLGSFQELFGAFETMPGSLIKGVKFESVDNRAIFKYVQARRV